MLSASLSVGLSGPSISACGGMSSLSTFSSKGKMRWCDMTEDDSEEDEQTETDMFPSSSTNGAEMDDCEHHTPNLKGDSNTPPTSSSPSSMDAAYHSPSGAHLSQPRNKQDSIYPANSMSNLSDLDARALSEAQIHTPLQNQHVSTIHQYQNPTNSISSSSSSLSSPAAVGFGGLFKPWTSVVAHTVNPASASSSSSAATLIDNELDSSRHGLPLLLKQAAAVSTGMDDVIEHSNPTANVSGDDMSDWEKVKGSKKRTHAESNAKAGAASEIKNVSSFKVPSAPRKPNKHSPPQLQSRSHSSASASSVSPSASVENRPPAVRLVKKDAMQVTEAPAQLPAHPQSAAAGWSRAKSVQLIRGISGVLPTTDSDAVQTPSADDEMKHTRDAGSVSEDGGQFQRAASTTKKSKKQRISHAHYREVTPASTPRQTPREAKQPPNNTVNDMDHMQLNSGQTKAFAHTSIGVSTPKQHPHLQKHSSATKPAGPPSAWQGWGRKNSSVRSSNLANGNIQSAPSITTTHSVAASPSVDESAFTGMNDSENLQALQARSAAVSAELHSIGISQTQTETQTQTQLADPANQSPLQCTLSSAPGSTELLNPSTAADSEFLCRRTLSLESSSSILSDISHSSNASEPIVESLAATSSSTLTSSAAGSGIGVVKKVPPVLSWDDRLKQRQKQIDIGRRTLGYQRYTAEVPKQRRSKQQPRTPDIHKQCSKRSWDGQVRKWRRQLHLWDPPGMEQPKPNGSHSSNQPHADTDDEDERSVTAGLGCSDDSVSSAEAELRALEAEELIEQVAAGRM